MSENSRVGEVIEASTTEFVAQCYELYQSPPLGSLVKTIPTPSGPVELYGIVYQVTTTGLDPGRRPIARGKDEIDEEAIYQASPQLEKLLRTESGALVVGHKRFNSTSSASAETNQHEQENKLFYYLPPKPTRIHSFVYQCSSDEIREFGQSFDFLSMLLSTHLPILAEELTAASLRQMSSVHPDPHTYLVAAGKELAILLASDYNRLKAILGRIRE
ncbi:MAG TPA: hypothetical protein QGE92_04170 [Dehalococcoidales bacterium]|nr:hypothetical protein [Dehalococcoidales bacterium]